MWLISLLFPSLKSVCYSDCKLDILAVSETKTEEIVVLQNFKEPVIHSSGKDSTGGVALYLHSSIENSTTISSLQGKHFESVWVLCTAQFVM